MGAPEAYPRAKQAALKEELKEEEMTVPKAYPRSRYATLTETEEAKEYMKEKMTQANMAAGRPKA